MKHITTGEGGMITTDNADYADRMRNFRNRGITTDHHQREKQGSWYYEMVDLGYNYRMTDFQCALGISQLQKLPRFLERRRTIAKQYDEAFAAVPEVNPLVHVKTFYMLIISTWSKLILKHLGLIEQRSLPICTREASV